MNFDLDHVLAVISTNFLRGEIAQEDAVHHYVWELSPKELSDLVEALSQRYQCVINTLSLLQQVHERLEVLVAHSNFLVVQANFQQVLFSSQQSARRAMLLRSALQRN